MITFLTHNLYSALHRQSENWLTLANFQTWPVSIYIYDWHLSLSNRWRWRSQCSRAHRWKLFNLVSFTPCCWGSTFPSAGTRELASWFTSHPRTGYACITILLLTEWTLFVLFILYHTRPFSCIYFLACRAGCAVCVVTLMGTSTTTWWAVTTSWRWTPHTLGTPGRLFPAVPM